MGNWLSLKTFEIQHALYGSRLRLWWVPVTNTHLVSCWGKTNGVLVLLESWFLYRIEHYQAAVLLIPISHKTHGLAERCQAMYQLYHAPSLQDLTSMKSSTRLLPVNFNTSTTLLALACSKSTPDLKATWLVLMGINGGKASHWTQSHCCKSVFWIAKSSQTSKPNLSNIWNLSERFLKRYCWKHT